MSEATGEKKSKTSRRLLAILLVLLLFGAIGYLAGYFKEASIEVADEGEVDLSFTGCDDADRCADFTLFAPGYDYRWTFNKSRFDLVDGDQPPLEPAVRELLSRAEGAIASGLASREGSSAFNRRLSACRSLRLADLLADVAGDASNIYRVTLGRYVDADREREDTSIERLVVMAFIMRTDDGVDLSQALKDGLSQELPPLLDQFLPEIVTQLQFTNYECWEEEFSVTQRDQIRTACFRETTRNYNDFCSDF